MGEWVPWSVRLFLGLFEKTHVTLVTSTKGLYCAWAKPHRESGEVRFWSGNVGPMGINYSCKNEAVAFSSIVVFAITNDCMSIDEL